MVGLANAFAEVIRPTFGHIFAGATCGGAPVPRELVENIVFFSAVFVMIPGPFFKKKTTKRRSAPKRWFNDYIWSIFGVFPSQGFIEQLYPECSKSTFLSRFLFQDFKREGFSTNIF